MEFESGMMSAARPGEEVTMSATESLTYAYPRRVEFVDELPKTLTGKIRRIELREAEREQVK
jgi:acyl-coenzyme A synthetase/AMP-(fatty) acid ligase